MIKMSARRCPFAYIALNDTRKVPNNYREVTKNALLSSNNPKQNPKMTEKAPKMNKT